MPAPPARPCPNCGSRSLYWTSQPDSWNQLLPGLGHFLCAADIQTVICSECGLTRFFASPGALRKLRETNGQTATATWFKLTVPEPTDADTIALSEPSA